MESSDWIPHLDDSSELQVKVPFVSHHYVTATATLKLQSGGGHSTCWEVKVLKVDTYFYLKEQEKGLQGI